MYQLKKIVLAAVLVLTLDAFAQESTPLDVTYLVKPGLADFYDRRYNIGLSERERQDLVNFLGAL
jgi:hypothetical protein